MLYAAVASCVDRGWWHNCTRRADSHLCPRSCPFLSFAVRKGYTRITVRDRNFGVNRAGSKYSLPPTSAIKGNSFVRSDFSRCADITPRLRVNSNRNSSRNQTETADIFTVFISDNRSLISIILLSYLNLINTIFPSQ